MKRKIVMCLVMMCVMTLAGSAQAGTVTFSGRDWTTLDGVHRDDPSILSEYIVNNADSMTMTGVYGGDTAIFTPISVNVGDVVSYDYYLTKEMRDPVGDGDTDYIGDSAGGPMTDAGWVSYGSYAFFDNGYTWLWSAPSGWVDVSVTDATAPTTGVHFDWEFDSASSYILTATAIGNGVQIGSWAGSADIATITQWKQGIWDSEQSVTVANFVPEPATMMLLGLGGLLIRRKKQF